MKWGYFMKYKTTKKAVMAGYNTVISVGYCDLQKLLSCRKPIAYTAGVYGWNADIYDIGNDVALVTGYRPFGNVKITSGLCGDYEKLAKNIRNNSHNDEIAQQLDKLIEQFAVTVTSLGKGVN